MYQKVTYSKLVPKGVFWKSRKGSIIWNKLTRSRHTYIHSRSNSCSPCGQRHGSKALARNSARAIVSLFGSPFLRLPRKPEGIVLSVHFRLGPPVRAHGGADQKRSQFWGQEWCKDSGSSAHEQRVICCPVAFCFWFDYMKNFLSG